MKKLIFMAAFLLAAIFTAEAQEPSKTLYLIDGVPVAKETVDQLSPDAIQNMNVMRGVESVVLVTTKKEADIAIVRYPKQTQSTVIKIDKQTDEVTIDEKLNGTTLRFHKKNSPAQEGDPLILIKKADGTIQRAESVGDVKPEDIQTISVYKDAEHLQQFEPYGETKGGVIYIELKK